MKRRIYIAFLAAVLVSCSPKISSGFEGKKQALTIEDKVALLDLYHKVPEGSQKLGNAKFTDTGFTTDCGFDDNLIKARKLARENGANIVKVVEKKIPDLLSSCYRLKLEFYYYPEDVSTIPQYQLQIN